MQAKTATKYAGPRTHGSAGPTYLKRGCEFQDGRIREWDRTRPLVPSATTLVGYPELV